MNDHIFLLQSERLRDGVSRALRTLRRSPHFRFAVAKQRQRGRGLHGGVRQQRRVIFRLDDFPALREGLIHVTVLAHDLARLARRFLQLLLVGVRIPNAVRALLPFDLQFFPSLHRRPSIIRKYSHAAERLESDGRLERFDGFRLLHACDTKRRFVIHGLHTAAEDRRTRHACIQHSIHARILPVSGFAGAHVLEVVAHGAFADVAPLASRLELYLFLFRNVQFRRCRREFPVA